MNRRRRLSLRPAPSRRSPLPGGCGPLPLVGPGTLFATALVALALWLAATPIARANADRWLDRLASVPRQGVVFDEAGVVPEPQRRAIESLLLRLEQQTGAQVKVVTLRSLEGGQIEDFANRLFERWGIGRQGKDDGVLLLAVIEDRAARIEVGYGLEAAIPDARAGRILDQYALPWFRQGDYGRGLYEAARAIAQLVAHHAGCAWDEQDTAPPALDVSGPPRPIHRLLTALFVLVFIYMAIRHPIVLFSLLGHGGGRSSGGFGGGGFGGGFSGGGGASRRW